MGQLTNQYVSSSYQGLLKMTDSTQGLTNTLQTIQTGDGDNSPLQMSLTEVNISGSFYINNVPITNGTNGTSGTSGSNGTDGSSGTSGSNGTNGSSGSNGTNGSSGTSGSNGTNGSSGTSGGTGSSGTSGTSGSNGSDGSSGTSGSNGSDGSSGTSGSNGTDGSSGTSGDSIFAQTGSLWNTTRNIGITGSLFISSSVASDVVINGQLYVSSSSTNAANAPRITVSGSNGITTINRNSITINTTTNYAALNPTITYIGDTATSDELGYTIDPVSYGVSGWTKGAAIYTNDPTDSYPAMIGFQNKANYTNGTVTILNGLDVSGSVNITGNYLINGSPIPTGSGGGDRNGLITTGSIGTTQDISGSLTDFGGNIFIVQSGQTVPFRITGSQAGGNIIMGLGNDPFAPQSDLSGSWSITGSNNIIMNGLIPDESYSLDPGYKAYLSGSNNILFGQPSTQNGILVQSSSVMLPTMNSNILGGYVNLGFTTSSLAKPIFSSNIGTGPVYIYHQSGSVNMINNITNNQIFSTANKTTLGLATSISTNIIGPGTVTLNHNSSSIQYNNNIGGGITVSNNYSSSVSTAVNNINVNNNSFQGTLNSITVSGSNSGTRRTVGNVLIAGRSNEVNSIYSGSFTGGHLVSTAILGQNLIVSASNTNSTIGGSTFVGRFNATGSLQESSQETVFVVGTGTAAGSRRNALRIDNNNNSNFTGSVNISGSLILNGVAVGGSDRNGLITTGSAGGSQSITGSLSVNGSQSNTGSVTISGAANGLAITGNAGGLSIQSGSIQLNNDGQSSISNQGTGRNVMYVDNVYSNFFFGNVPKGQSGRFSGDTGNFIVSPTYAAFETGSNNILLGTANIGLLSGSNNIRIGGEPNFGSSDYSDTLYIGGSGGVNANIIRKFGASGPLQLGYSTQVTGSLTVTGSLSVGGNLQFNVGAFQSTQTQSGSANVSQSITYDTTDYSQGVTYVSGSRLTVANKGVYNIQFSAQIDRVAGSGTDTVHIWLKKNGTNLAGSAGSITISGGAAAAKTISSWNYVVDSAANDYYELVWEPTDSNIQLIAAAATGNIPSIPSIITTVTQVR